MIAPPLGSHGIRVAELLALGTLAMFVALIYAVPFSETALEAFTTVVLIVAAMGSVVVLSVIAGTALNRRDRWGWRLLALGLGAWGTGEALWFGYTMAGVDPFPSPADAAYLVGYPLLGVGIAVLSAPARSLAQIRVGLEGLAVACLAAASLWFVVFPPAFSSGEDLVTSLITIAYPFLDVVLLVALLAAFGSGSRLPVSTTAWLVAGLVAVIAADMAFLLTEFGAGYTAGIIDAGWLAGYLLIALSALVWRRKQAHATGRQARFRSEESWSQYVVLMVPLAAVVFLASRHLELHHTPSDFAFGVFVVAGVLGATLRHAVAQRDQFQTNRRLRVIGEELRAAVQEAERASAAKSEFLSRMSHELRTPMNAVLGFGQLLELDDLSDEQRENVDYILSSGRHLLRLIDEVLEISRIEAGKGELSMQPFAPEQLVSEVTGLMRPLAAEMGITLQTGACPPELMAVGDIQRTKQALLNLVSNAIKYNNPGGRVSVKVDAAAHGRLAFCVSDTGPGIPGEKLERLFHPFERVGAEKTGVQGTGLGLALSRALVEAMGGVLDVESKPGIGSTFSIQLPAVVRASPVRADDQEQYLTVVYAEEDFSNFGAVDCALRQLGDVRLFKTSSAGEAMALVRGSVPDLVFFGSRLDDMTVLEALRMLKTEPGTASVPVVVLNTGPEPLRAGELRTAGAAGLVTMPLDVTELLATVRFLTGKHAAAA